MNPHTNPDQVLAATTRVTETALRVCKGLAPRLGNARRLEELSRKARDVPLEEVEKEAEERRMELRNRTKEQQLQLVKDLETVRMERLKKRRAEYQERQRQRLPEPPPSPAPFPDFQHEADRLVDALRATGREQEAKTVADLAARGKRNPAVLLDLDAYAARLAKGDGQGQQAGSLPKVRNKRMSAKDANLRLREVLKKKPYMKAQEAAAFVGCSRSQLYKLPDWRGMIRVRKADRIPLVSRLTDRTLDDVKDSRTLTPPDDSAELERLIEEQKRDMKSEERGFVPPKL